MLGTQRSHFSVRNLMIVVQRDGNYTLHPAVLDASFHACVHPLMTKSTDPNVYYLPAGVNVISVYDAMDRQALCAEHVFAYVQLKAWKPCAYSVCNADDACLQYSLQPRLYMTLHCWICADNISVLSTAFLSPVIIRSLFRRLLPATSWLTSLTTFLQRPPSPAKV